MTDGAQGFLVGLVGSGIGPSLTPPLHEREADELGLRYLYRRLDLDRLQRPASAVGEILAAAFLGVFLNSLGSCEPGGSTSESRIGSSSDGGAPGGRGDGGAGGGCCCGGSGRL